MKVTPLFRIGAEHHIKKNVLNSKYHGNSDKTNPQNCSTIKTAQNVSQYVNFLFWASAAAAAGAYFCHFGGEIISDIDAFAG